MPLFDFHCEVCQKNKNDVLVRNAEEIVLCDECKNQMIKMPSHINFNITPGAISHAKKTIGNSLPPEYKTSGGANIYGINRT